MMGVIYLFPLSLSLATLDSAPNSSLNKFLDLVAEDGTADGRKNTSPHIFFFLLDDVGYNDMLTQSTDISGATPNMNALADNGITLSRYYAELDCTRQRPNSN